MLVEERIAADPAKTASAVDLRNLDLTVAERFSQQQMALERPHAGMESNVAVNIQFLAFRNGHRPAVVPVHGVGVGDDRVQIIVATGKLENY